MHLKIKFGKKLNASVLKKNGGRSVEFRITPGYVCSLDCLGKSMLREIIIAIVIWLAMAVYVFEYTVSVDGCFS